MTTGPLSTKKWQQFRTRFLASLPDNTCHLCHQPVDLTLPGTHRYGPTLDHLIPLANGGTIYDPTNIALAHQHCNARRRNDTLTPRHSRQW